MPNLTHPPRGQVGPSCRFVVYCAALCHLRADDKDTLMKKTLYSICQFFFVYFMAADGKDSLCHPPADGKDLADGK